MLLWQIEIWAQGWPTTSLHSAPMSRAPPAPWLKQGVQCMLPVYPAWPVLCKKSTWRKDAIAAFQSLEWSDLPPLDAFEGARSLFTPHRLFAQREDTQSALGATLMCTAFPASIQESTWKTGPGKGGGWSYGIGSGNLIAVAGTETCHNHYTSGLFFKRQNWMVFLFVVHFKTVI